MARLTKFELENHLLRGDQLEWKDAARKKQKLKLSTAKSRRLFKYLLESTVRKPTELPQDFIEGLASSLKGDTDPADDTAVSEVSDSLSAWRLDSIDTLGLGGVNLFGGPSFEYEFDGESWLAEGPNGSGKSSLLGAITWAMTSMRPRDFGEVPADSLQPVYSISREDLAERKIGEWPPLAAFPTNARDLQTSPTVSVTLTFQDAEGNIANVSRSLRDGKITGSRSSKFIVPQILIESGLLMPARLATMKFGEGGNQLATSVQRLTGLDDHIAIGLLCEGLCNKAREYLSFRKKELSTAKDEFDTALSEVKTELRKIDRTFLDYEIKDTDDEKGALAALGKELNEKSAELTDVVSDDLSQDLDLSLPATQQAVAAAVIAAKQDAADGISALPYWKTVALIFTEIDDDKLDAIRTVVAKAKQDAGNILKIFQQTRSDNKFQLKAVAAAWHMTHAEGDFENCPLCANSLQGDLKQELIALQSAGEVASRTFGDSERAVVEMLTTALPQKLRHLGTDVLHRSPGDKIRSEIRLKFASNPKYSDKLSKFKSLVELALEMSPDIELASVAKALVDPKLKAIYNKIEFIEDTMELRRWFEGANSAWQDWWSDLVRLEITACPADTGPSLVDRQPENWTAHLNRLSEALSKAEPYRLGASALRRAWRSGRIARGIEVELVIRQDVAEAIEPLKLLGSLADSEVRETIDGLANRMQATLNRTLISDRIQFETARFSKREGVSVRAAVSENVLIDASLIVNASWMRAVLWAFIFALREEAVEQLGGDQFPLMVLDDPQGNV